MNRGKRKRDIQEFYYGYNFCELQGLSPCQGGLQAHHIIFRSAIPNHKHQNHQRNLALICTKHHNECHGVNWKLYQSYRVRERKLWELYPNTLHDRYKEDKHQMPVVRPRKLSES